ncbi:MAG: hypothetical protein AAF805_15210 [Planctomycetota bacterium]
MANVSDGRAYRAAALGARTGEAVGFRPASADAVGRVATRGLVGFAELWSPVPPNHPENKPRCGVFDSRAVIPLERLVAEPALRDAGLCDIGWLGADAVRARYAAT